jgi:hypothetical protein
MPIVAFLCSFYGGMPENWLSMPVKTFFAMYREGVKMEARRFSELADISLVADNMQISYYMQLKERYDRIINPEKKQLPPEAPGPALDAGGEDGKMLMMSVARGLKKRLGYGG